MSKQTNNLTSLYNRFDALNRSRHNSEESNLIECFLEVFNMLLDNYSSIKSENKLDCFYTMLNRYLVALEQSEVLKF